MDARYKGEALLRELASVGIYSWLVWVNEISSEVVILDLTLFIMRNTEVRNVPGASRVPGFCAWEIENRDDV
jgi:hypothetical protein